jgi:hypothetical protein
LIYDAYREIKDKVNLLRSNEKLLTTIHSLLSLAPNTEAEAKGMVEKEWEWFTTVRDSFRDYPDDYM